MAPVDREAPRRNGPADRLAFVLATAVLAATVSAELLIDRVTILAPASIGGGWDQTARAMQQALIAQGLARDVQVENSPGAGGAIGLAQFVNAQRGDGRSLLVGGLFMITAIRLHAATVSLSQTTPIARLTGDYEVIAVPAGSPIHELPDLVQALRLNPGSVSWGGGSGGGVDQLLLYELARAIQVDPVLMNYVAFAGGGEVAAELLASRVGVGISGYGELRAHLEAGRLRALAVSSPTRLAGLGAPTFNELGIPVGLVNWRGVFAPAGLSDEDREQLQRLVAAMVRTPEWTDTLRRHGWTDLYLAGDDFVRFLVEEEARASDTPDPRGTRSPATSGGVWTSGMWLLRNRVRLAAVLAIIGLAAVVLFAGQRRASAQRERDLTERLEAVEAQYQQRSAETQDLLRGLSEQIDRQFVSWSLTAAEREVAMLMLKGLRHKEIASVRGTSERTVRQQALTVYKKGRLDGRTDLAAFFLEDMLQPLRSSDQKRTA